MKPIWLNDQAKKLNDTVREQALAHQMQLTKPPGALGRLEDIAVSLAAMQGQLKPSLENVHISVFAGDHGIAVQRVSAFPQAVTTEMVKNFARGGAAISVLARSLGAKLEVINLGTINDPGVFPNVLDRVIAPSTADFSQQEAMTVEQLNAALEAGRESVSRAVDSGANIFVGGEMGIANTSSATAIASMLLNEPVSILAGPGTGLDSDGVSHKVKVLEASLQLHKHCTGDAYETLRCLGGFEIAALCGAYISCAQHGLPVLIDGFISSAAALCAAHLCDNASDWFLYSHASAEPGHHKMMTALGAQPLLDFGMRLGEASGAATALPLLRMACDLHAGMATFEQAGVSEKSS